MKNCIILAIKESTEQVCFAVTTAGDATLFTEADAVRELEDLHYIWPHHRFQIVVLRLGETTEFDRTD